MDTPPQVGRRAFFNAPPEADEDAASPFCNDEGHEEEPSAGAHPLASVPKEVRVHFRKEVAVKLWLQEVLDEKFENSFVLELCDGTLLCRLMEILKPRSIPRIHCNSVEFFKIKSNILFFLEAAEDYGVSKHLVFKVCDLYNQENIPKVIHYLVTLGMVAAKNWGGPRLDTKINRATLEANSWCPKSRLETISKCIRHNREARSSTIFTHSRVKAAKDTSFLSDEEIARVTPGVTRLQAIVRGRIARARYRKLLRKAAFRQHAAKEILATEQSYAKQMILLNNLFLNPLIERDVEDPYEIGLSAMNEEVTKIIACSNKLIELLKPRISHWDVHQVIGDVFLEMTEDMKTYANFLKKYSPFLQELSEAKKDEWFQMTLKELESNPLAKWQPFESFLIQPIQRIPRYPMMLKELLSHTPKEHPDYESLSLASDQMIAVARYVNERKREFENMSQVMEVQQEWTGKFENLATPHRTILRQAIVFSILTGKQHKLYLFNDLFVVANPSYVKRQCKFKVKEQYELRDVVVVDDLAVTAAKLGDETVDEQVTGTVFHVLLRSGEEEEAEYCYQMGTTGEASAWKRDVRKMQYQEEKLKEERLKKALDETHGKWTKPSAPPELLLLLQQEVAGKQQRDRKTIAVGDSPKPLCRPADEDPSKTPVASPQPDRSTPGSSRRKRLTINGLSSLFVGASPSTSKSGKSKESSWLGSMMSKKSKRDSKVVAPTRSSPVLGRRGGEPVTSSPSIGRERMKPAQTLTHASEPMAIAHNPPVVATPPPEKKPKKKERPSERVTPRRRMTTSEAYAPSLSPASALSTVSEADARVQPAPAGAVSRVRAAGGSMRRRRPKSMAVPRKPLPQAPGQRKCASEIKQAAPVVLERKQSVDDMAVNRSTLAEPRETMVRQRSRSFTVALESLSTFDRGMVTHTAR